MSGGGRTARLKRGMDETLVKSSERQGLAEPRPRPRVVVVLIVESDESDDFSKSLF